MADKTIKHFVFVQFFSWQNPKYPYDVFDVDFLSTQLPLAKNILRSLENQTNKNFEVAFYTHPKLLSDSKYEIIFSELKNSTTLPIKIILHWERRSLVKEALNEYDFVIQTRMDFDDFIFKDAVEDTQSKINECEDILVYGYCKGYTYLYNELYTHFNRWGGVGHIGIFQSLILKSAFAKTIDNFCIANFYHHQFVIMLKEFLEKNDIEFSDRMFQQNTTTDAYIYFRHECSQDQWRLFGTSQFKIPNRPLLTTADITKKQLEDEFGFHLELNSIK